LTRLLVDFSKTDLYQMHRRYCNVALFWANLDEIRMFNSFRFTETWWFARECGLYNKLFQGYT